MTQVVTVDGLPSFRAAARDLAARGVRPDDLIFRDADAALNKWLRQPDLAFFESSVISVRRDDYVEALRRFRDACNRTQSDMEASEADVLVHFNVQVYPFP